MAVVSIDEIWDRSHTLDDKFDRQYTRTFRAITSNQLDGPLQIRQHASCPAIGDVYVNASANETDLGSRCRSVTVAVDQDDPQLWTITCEYSTQAMDPDRQEQDPLLRATKVRVSSQKYQRPLSRDRSLKAVVNSAGKPFEAGSVEIDHTRPILTFTRYEAVQDLGTLGTYADSINSAPWFGYPKYKVKLDSIQYEEKEEQGSLYYLASYVFHIKNDDDGWLFRPLDQGFQHYQGVDINRVTVNFRDENLEVSSEPGLLNGAGYPLKDAATLLVGDITAAALNLDVFENGAFPTAVAANSETWFQVKIEEEILTVTANPTTAWTVLRGQQGTTAAIHLNNEVVEMRPFYLTIHGYPEKDFNDLNLP